jgi:hypothetical protein
MASLWVNVASGKRLASSSVSSDAWRLSPQNASARAALLSNDTAAARTSYDQFLAQWKGADSSLPVLNEARRELAALR